LLQVGFNKRAQTVTKRDRETSEGGVATVILWERDQVGGPRRGTAGAMAAAPVTAIPEPSGDTR
jgi:hypothetical protein